MPCVKNNAELALHAIILSLSFTRDIDLLIVSVTRRGGSKCCAKIVTSFMDEPLFKTIRKTTTYYVETSMYGLCCGTGKFGTCEIFDTKN